MTACFALSESRGIFFQFFAALIASLLALTDGMALGWTAPMIPYLTSDDSHIKMTLAEAEWLETWLMIGILFALPFTILAVENLGRKKALLLSCLVLIACWLVVTLANRIEYLYAARFFKGSGLNMAFVAAPMYIGEIAHKDFRGFIASMIFVLMMLGTLLIYSIVPFVSFYVPSIIAVGVLSTQLVVFSFMPETPFYLLRNNKLEEARRSLQKFRGASNIEEELQEILKAVETEKKEDTTALMILLRVKSHRRALIIVWVVSVAQPFACHEIILMNLHEILNSAGSVYVDASIAAIIFAALMMVAAIAASLLVDKFGRKKLLVPSILLTGLCLLTLAVYFHLRHAGYLLEAFSWIPIVAVMLYAILYKIGMGMVPIVITTEIYAPKVKALGMTLADGFYVTASIVSLQIFFHLKSIFGMHAPFYVFSGWAVFTLLFVVFFVPETKGKGLEEIQQILRGEKIDSANDSKDMEIH